MAKTPQSLIDLSPTISILLNFFLGFTQSYAALVRDEEYSSMVSKNDNMVNTNKVMQDLKNIMTKKEGMCITFTLSTRFFWTDLVM